MFKANPDLKAKSQSLNDHQKEEADIIKVGDRCETCVGAKRGEVKYVGKVDGLEKGYWVGIQLDEPIGDCNGAVGGK